MLTQSDVRRRRIGGAVAVLIGGVLIVLAFLAFTGRLGATDKNDGASDAAKSAGAGTSHSSESSAPSDPSGSESSAPPADAKAPLTVLNGGGVAGLAAAGQAEFEAAGWTVAEVGNYVSELQLEQSTVFYSGGDDEAQAAATALAEQFPDLVAAEAPSDLGFDGVVVVLTGEWVPGG